MFSNESDIYLGVVSDMKPEPKEHVVPAGGDCLGVQEGLDEDLEPLIVIAHVILIAHAQL